MSHAESFLDRLDEVGERIRETDRTAARSRVLDTLGAMLAGAAWVRRALPGIGRLGATGSDTARAVGFAGRTDEVSAALLNGIAAHWLELDDGQRHGDVHPGAPAVAALTALASAGHITGDGFVRGVIVGYEAAVALAVAMQPGLRDRGFHATGPCGTVGAALGAAEALGIPRRDRGAILAAASTTAAGLLLAIQDGSDLKAVNAGNAAAAGLRAVHLGRAGFSGPHDALAGRFGILEAMTSTPDLGVLSAPSTSGALIHSCYLKPYPACRHAHGPIELSIALRSEHEFSPEAIRSVIVHTYRQAVLLHEHTDVEGATDARMSTPFAVATALVRGRAHFEDFTGAALADRDVLALAAKVLVQEDPELSARTPDVRGARLEIALSDGRTLRGAVSLPFGEPERPLDRSAVEGKFLTLWAASGRDPRDGRDAIAAIASLESSLPEAMRLLLRSGGAGHSAGSGALGPSEIRATPDE